jgi:hypothetical protein
LSLSLEGFGLQEIVKRDANNFFNDGLGFWDLLLLGLLDLGGLLSGSGGIGSLCWILLLSLGSSLMGSVRPVAPVALAVASLSVSWLSGSSAGAGVLVVGMVSSGLSLESFSWSLVELDDDLSVSTDPGDSCSRSWATSSTRSTSVTSISSLASASWAAFASASASLWSVSASLRALAFFGVLHGDFETTLSHFVGIDPQGLGLDLPLFFLLLSLVQWFLFDGFIVGVISTDVCKYVLGGHKNTIM